MNISDSILKEEGKLLSKVMLFLVFVFGISFLTGAESDFSGESITFKAIEIKPSPYEFEYEGVFLFENKTKNVMSLSVLAKPEKNKIIPDFVKFEILRNGKWIETNTSYCGLALTYNVDPHEKCEIYVTIPIDEKSESMTARLGFADQNFWSEPFTINWERDQKEGKFLNAKNNYLEKIKNAFKNANFKDDLLVENSFPNQFSREIISAMSLDYKKEISNYKKEIIPRIRLDGSVEIHFESNRDDISKSYDLNMIFNPLKINKKIFSELNESNISTYVNESQKVVALFSFSDKSETDLFSLEIKYPCKAGISERKMEVEAKQCLKQAVQIMVKWMIDK